jgi:hypothetical protein
MYAFSNCVPFGAKRYLSLVTGLILFLGLGRTVSAATSVHFASNNFTLCQESSYLNVTSVSRLYQASTRTLNFTIQGVSPITMNNLNAAKTCMIILISICLDSAPIAMC